MMFLFDSCCNGMAQKNTYVISWVPTVHGVPGTGKACSDKPLAQYDFA